jgi:hypothetical protein
VSARYDPEAEFCIVSGCLAFPDAFPPMLDVLDPTDFYDQRYAKLWGVMGDLHRSGSKIDPLTVHAASGEPTSSIRDLIGEGLRPHGDHVSIVLGHSAARRMQKLIHEMDSELSAGGDAFKLADRISTDLGSIDTPDLASRYRGVTMREFLSRVDERASEWIIPGIMRRSWRAIIVASEGRGKSTLLRQIGMCASQGIHPFRFSPMKPIRVMLVDLENDGSVMEKTASWIDTQCQRTATDYDETRLHVIEGITGGINIRTRTDRAALERDIASFRPDLVIMGPTYKMSRKDSKENYEDEALPVIAILEDLTTRYAFGLILESHAPKGASGHRVYEPYGSGMWLRWPHIGYGLPHDKKDGSLSVDPFRGDRMETDWPEKFVRSQVWPWAGRWANSEPLPIEMPDDEEY